MPIFKIAFILIIGTICLTVSVNYKDSKPKAGPVILQAK